MKIFNRNDSATIQAAVDNSLEKFLLLYKDTTTPAALSKAYKEIRLAYIKANPGSREKLLKEVVNNNILDITEGEPMIAPSQEADIKLDGKVIGKLKSVSVDKQTVVTVGKKSSSSKELVGETKQDKIVNLIKNNPDISNKEITELLKGAGFNVYGSEILNAKKKIR